MGPKGPSKRYPLDRREGRRQPGDAALAGAPGRARPGAGCRADPRGARAPEGAGARGSRAMPGERDPQAGVGACRPGGARPPLQAMGGQAVDPVPAGSRRLGRAPAGAAFVDAHRGRTGSRRSPRRPSTPMRPAMPTRASRRRGGGGTPCGVGRSAGSGTRTAGARGRARSGGRGGGRASASPVAAWPGGGAAPGAAWRRSSLRPSPGPTGSTTAAG
jgi:hypothetical protein